MFKLKRIHELYAQLFKSVEFVILTIPLRFFLNAILGRNRNNHILFCNAHVFATELLITRNNAKYNDTSDKMWLRDLR